MNEPSRPLFSIEEHLGPAEDPGRGPWTLKLRGECDLAVVEELTAALDRASRQDAQVVVDLSELEFLDSSCMRCLLVASERIPQGRLRIVLGPPAVMRVFEISGLLERLPFDRA